MEETPHRVGESGVLITLRRDAIEGYSIWLKAGGKNTAFFLLDSTVSFR
jgi:hypothetical protein